MSLKDFLLFLGQADDGKEKPTVFGKLKRILDAIGNPTDTSKNTIFGKQNENQKLIRSQPVFNMTSIQTAQANGSSGGDRQLKKFSMVFSLPENATFYALMVSGTNHNGQTKDSQISIESTTGSETYKFDNMSFPSNAGQSYYDNTFFMGKTVIGTDFAFADCARAIYGKRVKSSQYQEISKFAFCSSYTIPISNVRKITFSGTLQCFESSESYYTAMRARAIYSTLN